MKRVNLFCALILSLFIYQNKTQAQLIVTADDVLVVQQPGEFVIDPISNDYIDSSVSATISLLNEPFSGTAIVDEATQTIIYQPDCSVPFSFDMFLYQLECSVSGSISSSIIFVFNGMEDSNITFTSTEYSLEDLISQPDMWGVSTSISTNTNPVDICEIIGCVWPGDANGNGLVGIRDVLNVGIAYGMNGPPRLDQTINWEAQNSINWEFNLDSGTNYKHMDCNGDGTVDTEDLDIIVYNYMEISNKNDDLNSTDANYDLRIEILNETASEGDTIYAMIKLGNEFEAMDDVYGAAFSLVFDENLIDPESVVIDYNGSWMGSQDEILKVHYQTSGQIDLALTRMDQNNSSGGGDIIPMKFVMEEVLLGKVADEDKFYLDFVDAIVVNNRGMEIDVNAIGDEKDIVLTEIESGLRQGNLNDFNIYPNPAKNWVQIELANNSFANVVEIIDQKGKIVRHINVQNQYLKLNTSDLESGLYFVKAYSKDQVWTQKLNIVK